MSRSGYSDYDGSDNPEWALIRWRGAVASAIRGRRGQAFLRELLEAMDALPEKRLIADDLIRDGEVCALGALGLARGQADSMKEVDPEDYDSIADFFGIPNALTQEIEYLNDEFHYASPEDRFVRMRRWVIRQLIDRWKRDNLGWSWG